ncbi:MAG: helix-turn-helix domain-containing protein [Bacteroides sp.]|nr:helix-turn-helix domain-containing protein [Bacteroides sp.]
MNIDRENFEAWMVRIQDRFDILEKRLERIANVRNCLDGEELLDNQDLMMITKMSERTLQRLRSNGKLPYVSADNGKCLYRASDVRKFIRELL